VQIGGLVGFPLDGKGHIHLGITLMARQGLCIQLYPGIFRGEGHLPARRNRVVGLVNIREDHQHPVISHDVENGGAQLHLETDGRLCLLRNIDVGGDPDPVLRNGGDGSILLILTQRQPRHFFPDDETSGVGLDKIGGDGIVCD
jgi:hypothetical protein